MKEPTLPPPDYRGPMTGEPFWNLLSMEAALRQAAQVQSNPCLNDYVDKCIASHMRKLEANGFKLVPIEPTEAMIEAAPEVK